MDHGSHMFGGEGTVGSRRRRPRFREQTLGAIFLRMGRALLYPRQAGGAMSRRSTAGQNVDTTPQADDAQATFILPLVMIIGLVVAVVIIAIFVLVNVFNASNGSVLPVVPGASSPTPNSVVGVTPQTIPMVPTKLGTLAALRTFSGGQSGSMFFVQPQDAVQAPNGLIYVADTGNHRVVELDKAGRLVRSITTTSSGPLLSPYSLALTPAGDLLVLDSDAGQIIEYDASGAQVRASAKGLGIGHARGIATDRQGHVFVANTPANSVVVIGSDLMTVISEIPGIAPDGTQRFNQPSAVMPAPDGSLYVVDSQYNRLVQVNSGAALLHSWPLTVPDTLHSPHLLLLTDGRVLVTDPRGGNLLVYHAAATQPASYMISPGGPNLIPLGLASAGKGKVVVTCYGTDQVLILPLPN